MLTFKICCSEIATCWGRLNKWSLFVYPSVRTCVLCLLWFRPFHAQYSCHERRIVCEPIVIVHSTNLDHPSVLSPISPQANIFFCKLCVSQTGDIVLLLLVWLSHIFCTQAQRKDKLEEDTTHSTRIKYITVGFGARKTISYNSDTWDLPLQKQIDIL